LGSQEKYLCENCFAQLVAIQTGFCDKCGSDLSEGYCLSCSETKYIFEFSRSALLYQEPVVELIHKLKYEDYRGLAHFFADRMNESLKLYPEFEDYPYLMAVPLHKVRRRERGYNQSALIAKRLAHLSGKEAIRPIERKRYTKSQTQLSRSNRLTNLAGAFIVKEPTQVQGKNIIIIDDVFTTGSTLNEISLELYKAGAGKVACLTATRA